MDGESPPRPRPHVVIFPLPAQGHVNSMLKLAELFCLFNLRITFLNSERNHRRLIRHSDAMSRFARHDGFRFKEISDGIPADQDASLSTDDSIMSILNYLKDSAKGVLEDIVNSAAVEGSPVTCIIADGILSFVIDVGEEIGGVPVIIFRTISVCCFWAYFCIPQMIESGELPIRDMDRLITSIPGAEGFLRCRDLPSFCRTSDISNPTFQYVTTQTCQSTRAPGIIFNTCEGLDHPILSNIRPHFTNKVYAVGPLHSHLKSRAQQQQNHSFSNSLLEEDRSCLSWLDRQPPRSVLYVSFGSITVLKPEEVTEFMFGIINSKCRFLWVMRPDSVAGRDEGHDGDQCQSLVPVELRAAAEERGCFVKWAPQEDVLGHPAVTGFLTHSGWNSTLESVAVGVPMLCWPYFADQQINSRFVSDVWRIGVDMKDQCDRVVVERMINDLMVERREDLANSAEDKARLVKEAVSEGGSSWEDLNGLVADICSMSLGNNS